MGDSLRLMAILAHPDDETLGTGGTFARYAGEGVETYLVTATRGERGWFGPPEENPGLHALGQIREQELAAAAQMLGIRQFTLLDYIDGELAQAPAQAVIRQLVDRIRAVRPQVVITFDPFGVYGHPDHIAICQWATTAVHCAADPAYQAGSVPQPHSVAKLYYLATTQSDFDLYTQAFGELVMEIDGVPRWSVPWPRWAITTHLDTSAYQEQVWQAVFCHRSQLREYEKLLALPGEAREQLWRTGRYYRVFSRVPVNGPVEDDLFSGLRGASAAV